MLLGVLLFAIDRLSDVGTDAATRLERNNAATAAATGAGLIEPARQDTQVGVFEHWVDEGNRVLRRPFEGLVPSDADAWTRELVPAFLALLLYGVGLSKVATSLNGRARRARARRHLGPPPTWQ